MWQQVRSASLESEPTYFQDTDFYNSEWSGTDTCLVHRHAIKEPISPTCHGLWETIGYLLSVWAILCSTIKRQLSWQLPTSGCEGEAVIDGPHMKLASILECWQPSDLIHSKYDKCISILEVAVA